MNEARCCDYCTAKAVAEFEVRGETFAGCDEHEHMAYVDYKEAMLLMGGVWKSLKESINERKS